MDTIGRQVTAFVSLFMVIALMLLMYLIFEPQRRLAAAEEQRHMASERGAHLFAENCVVCHGPQGQGIAGAGFPLNTEDNRAPDEDRRDYLREVLNRGRANSTGNLPNMPVFLVDEGGSLNAQQIDDLITFMGYGDWREVEKIVTRELGTPVAAIPTPPGLGTPDPNPPSGGGPRAPVQAPAASADPMTALFVTNCGTCHRIAPEHTRGGRIGPELTGIGAKSSIPTSSRNQPATSVQVNEEGMARWIRNPAAIKPGTAMPAFGPDKLSDTQLNELVTWLLGHK